MSPAPLSRMGNVGDGLGGRGGGHVVVAALASTRAASPKGPYEAHSPRSQAEALSEGVHTTPNNTGTLARSDARGMAGHAGERTRARAEDTAAGTRAWR